MSLNPTSEQADFTDGSSSLFAATIAAGVFGQPPSETHNLFSGEEREWYRSTDAKGTTLLVIVSASLNRQAELFAQEYTLLTTVDGTTAVLRPLAIKAEAERTGIAFADPGGSPLAAVLKSKQWERDFSLGRKLDVAYQSAKALRLVHESGLVHGDVRPENCFLCSSGAIALTGFGRASRVDTASAQPASHLPGPPAYLSPQEVWSATRRRDQRSDVYSLGVTLFEILTGTLPFSASDPLEWAHRHFASTPPKASLKSSTLPEQIDWILLGMLEKDPDRRYQTAGAVESDLRRCATDWLIVGKIDRFPVGRGDLLRKSGHENVLYGRDVARQLLLNAGERVAAGGASELVLVTGPAGVGKSSLVRSVKQVFVGRGFLFAEGKFDQNRWETPYSSIVQGFRGLVRQLLAKEDSELADWRTRFTDALGGNAGLIVDLIPEMAHIIGHQPAVGAAELPNATLRFRYLFRAFVSVFATPAHPLVIFVDDLQWLDQATLDLIHGLATEGELRHTLLVVAYRDDEMESAQALNDVLAQVKKLPRRITEIAVSPLSGGDLERMLANILSCLPDRVAALAAIVGEKTGGNPFFALQFIRKLASDRVLTFQSKSLEFEWDETEVERQDVTANVAHLLSLQLGSLPDETKAALSTLSILGNSIGLERATFLVGVGPGDLERLLQPAAEIDMVKLTSASVSFTHDQVQRAAYLSMSAMEQESEHLRIGRLLLAEADAGRTEKAIYEIAGHFDKALNLIADEERPRVAVIFLEAGNRAKLASAYTTARSYFEKGLTALQEQNAKGQKIGHHLSLGLAECDIVNGNFGSADSRLSVLLGQHLSSLDRAQVVCLAVLLCFTTGRNAQAVETGVRFLVDSNIDWPLQPTHAGVVEEFQNLHRELAKKPIEDLLTSAEISDPHITSCMAVMTEVFPAAYAVDRRLMEFLLLRMTVLTLQHGLCDSSSVAFSALNMVLGAQFGDYATAYKFGELSKRLVERGAAGRYRARVYSLFAGFTVPWIQPLPECAPLTEEAFRISTATGDFAFAAYNARNHITHELISGKPLAAVQEIAEKSLAFARTIELGMPHENFFSQLRFIRKVRGIETSADRDVDCWALRQTNPLPGAAMMISYHWVFRLIEHYLSEDLTNAAEAAAKVEPIKWAMRSSIEEAELEFYAGLTSSALATRDGKSHPRHGQHMDELRRRHARMIAWSRECAETFDCREALLGAEVARLEGHSMLAQSLYERAISKARKTGFLQIEAIASELAGRFYLAQDLMIAASAYLTAAREAYAKWGAVTKVQTIDFRYIRSAEKASPTKPYASFSLPVASLDIDAVRKASRVLSSETILSSLIEKLMTLVLQHSGAERGALVLLSGSELYIEATAQVRDFDVEVRQDRRKPTQTELPASVLQYVLRTQLPVAVHDIASGVLDPGDEYLQTNQPRSILCVPVFNSVGLIGLLYVENTIVADIFSEDRTSVLDFLASQAGIWLGNARLYSELQRSEAWLREAQRLSHTGSFFWSDNVESLVCSEEFFRICGIPMNQALTIGNLAELVHPSERQDFLHFIENVQAFGSDIDRQFKLKLTDGTERDVRIATRTDHDLNGSRRHLGSIQDVSEMQRSQDLLTRISGELAQVSRTATLGVLAASIAHEVSQPLLGIVANSEACQMMLDNDPPDLVGARRTAARSLRDGNRAAETIRRLRGLFGKRTPAIEPFDLNEVVREVLTLAGNELQAKSITIVSSLNCGLPLASGDRIQVQQVVLNILLNAIDAIQAALGQRSIEVTTDLDGDDFVRVDIADNGCGIDSLDSERLFEAFYTTKQNGMGVGLSVSKAIIDSVGGQIWATANPRGGATFSFTLRRGTNSGSKTTRNPPTGSLPYRSS